MSETTPTTTSRTPRGTTNRRLFVRMLAAAMRRRRSRALAAILSSAVGSATLFCLAAVCLAVPAQMSAQMRQFGANLIVVPVASEGSAPRISFQEAADVDAAVATALGVGTDQLATAAYRYETVRINKSPYMLAGIDVDRVRTLNGHWEVTGHWPGPGEVLIGSDVAEAAGFTVGSTVTAEYLSSDNLDLGSQTSVAPDGSVSSDPLTPTAAPTGTATTAPGHAGHSGHAGQSGQGSVSSDDAASSQATPGHSGHAEHGGQSGQGSVSSDDAASSQATPGHSGHAGQSGQGSVSSDDAASSQATVGHHHTGPVPGSKAWSTAAASQDSANPASPTTPGQARWQVAGIVDTGGSEDDIVYANAADVDALTGVSAPGYDVLEFSVDTAAAPMSTVVDAVAATGDSVQAQPVAKITSGDTRIITMLNTLFWVVCVVVLALTLVGVSTTMTVIVSERRNEIGLRKALGASGRAIAVEFYSEAALLGLFGGLVGTAVGYGLAVAVLLGVFDSAAGFGWWLALVSVAVTVLVAVVAAYRPVRRAASIDPALVLREE